MIFKPFKEITLPVMGNGNLRIWGSGSEPDLDFGKQMVKTAIDHGITLFDCAYVYGKDGACEKVRQYCQKSS